MDRLEHLMSNTDLQDAIIHTNAMIKSCAPAARRMTELEQHLNTLLDVQISRASMAQAVGGC